jgi:hypothetical protein
MADELIVETAIRCLEREFPPGLTSLTALDDRVNAELRAHGTSVRPERLVELLACDPRVLVEYRDADPTPWVRLRSAVSDEDARARLVEILLEAETFDEIWGRITAESAGESHPLFRDALRFLAEGKPNAFDDPLKESFAQALGRFADDPRALELAGILRAHAEDLRRD